MMKIKSYLCLVLLLGLAAASDSQAAMLSIVGVGDSSSFSYSKLATGFSAPTTTSKFGFGAGALLDEPLGPRVDFELGALYITREIEVNATGTTQGGDDVTNTFHALQIPLLLKYRLMPMVHIGVGAYYAMGIGSIDAQDATHTANSNSSETYSAADFKKNDFGLLGDVGLTLPLGGGGPRILVDGRYAYGLTNVNTGSGINESYRDLQILLGLTFNLGGGRR